MRCSFVPPYLLRRLAGADAPHALEVDRTLRRRREEAPAAGRVRTAAAEGAGTTRRVHTANNTETLPGRLVRTDDDPATGDRAVDEAYDSSGQVLALFADEFGRRSIDGEGTPVSITVHFGRDYDNAFWDGTQLVFGDGDGVIFDRFTRPADVLAHEFTHGVSQFTAALAYADQSGALNESVSDVFAALTTQRARGQTADRADWLIGEGLFRPGVEGRALRSMLEPGTAYDDPRIGRDPQVGHLTDYVRTTDDNGGVHINSGIPNRAFALAARDLGGPAWERVGGVWYAALTGGELPARCDFATFAGATLRTAARVRPGDAELAEGIEAAWRAVGVLGPAASAGPTDAAAGAAAPATVFVRRSGGFAGTVRTAELDLDRDPEGAELRTLLQQAASQQVRSGPPRRDGFVYTVRFGAWQLTVPEADLPRELRRVVLIVLERGSG